MALQLAVHLTEEVLLLVVPPLAVLQQAALLLEVLLSVVLLALPARPPKLQRRGEPLAEEGRVEAQWDQAHHYL